MMKGAETNPGSAPAALLEELRRRLRAAERAGNSRVAASLRKQLSALADRAWPPERSVR